MYDASVKWKQAMRQRIRNRGYASVSIGVVDPMIQAGASIDTANTDPIAKWSSLTFPFQNREAITYATYEDDFIKADGTAYFMPPDEDTAQYLSNRGFVSEDFVNFNIFAPQEFQLAIDFDKEYELNGLSLEFLPDSYSTSFRIYYGELKEIYITDNTSYRWTSADLSEFEGLGKTDYIRIVFYDASPTTYNRRLHLNKILMGVGLNYQNPVIKSISFNEYVSPISEELPSTELSIEITDDNNAYTVDNDNSILNYLETEQNVELLYGMELDNGNTEYIPMGTLKLSDWSSEKGKMTFKAKDRLSFLDTDYDSPKALQTGKTLYDYAKAVFDAAGLEVDEYSIDDCLADISVVNPLPSCTYAEALQLIANAGRCKLYQNRDGLICIEANYEIVTMPSTYSVSSDTVTDWSDISTLVTGNDNFYGELTKDYFKMDGSMYFLPEDGNYGHKMAFASAEVSNSKGTFTTNPSFEIHFGSRQSYTYYDATMLFHDKLPKSALISVYAEEDDTEPSETFTWTDFAEETYIDHDFVGFQKIKVEFTEAEPYSRIIVNQFTFGDTVAYSVKQKDMTSFVGYREKRVSKVQVAYYTFEDDEEGVAQQTDVQWKEIEVSDKGTIAKFENQLISTEAQAETVGKWIANYYSDNVSYEVDYRGEPRLNAGDLVYLQCTSTDSDTGLIDRECIIENCGTDFSGGYSGTLTLRRVKTEES